jgi:hypothetical protein
MRAFGGAPSWRRIGIAVSCLPPISSGSLIPSKRASLTANDALEAHARSRPRISGPGTCETSRNYPLHAHFRQERRAGPGGVSMQLLYEKPAGAGLTPEMDQFSDPDRGRLPLPILLRVPRFAYVDSVSLPPSPTAEPIAAISPAKHHSGAAAFKFRSGRKRRKVVGLAALAMIVLPVAIVSRDPSLMAPLVAKWCGYDSRREPVKDIPDAASPNPSTTVTADRDVHPNRSAWLDDIVPFKPGESP